MRLKLFALVVILCAPVAFATCPATYLFPGSSVALNSSDWTQTTAGSSVSNLYEFSGVTYPTAASTQGMAIWVGSACTPGVAQYSQVVASSLATGSSTGPGVRGSSGGNGYVWLLQPGAIYIISALGGVSAVTTCPTYTSGHTYQLAIDSNFTLTGYDNGTAVCSGTDSAHTYSSGNPFILVDRRSSTTDSLSSFQTNSVVGFSISPTIIATGTTGNTITLFGSSTSWTAGTPGSPTFTVSGTSSCTITAQTVASNISATLTISAGSTAGTCIIHDPSTSITQTLTVHTPQTYFIRADGGSRYSSNVTSGQCNGLYDASYASTGGTGVNQNCAYNDFRFLWDDDSGLVGAGAWVISGGDTVVVRGCNANSNQTNPSNPNCRIGWDQANGSCSSGVGSNCWCYSVGSYTCYNPPIPAGSPGAHTKILGGCAYGTYTCTPINNNYPYSSTNETQIFGGFSLTWTFNLGSTSYVDIQGIELTTHNGGSAGQCVTAGSPAYPRNCATSSPVDDFARNGFLFNTASSNISFLDVYIHGFNASGLYGAIGGPITATRLFTGFNAFAGWNFSDDSDTPNASGSSLTQSYITMIGNGCNEEYPIVHTSFPANACYDTNTNGFGDSWSGQDSLMDSFSCDHCVIKYNTKDGFIGPHVQVASYSITNGYWYGNMGSQFKLGQNLNSTLLFQNNLIVSNCYRMAETVPGAKQNFNISTGLGGSYLDGFCRAGGNGMAMITRNGSVNHFYNNTIIGANNLIVEQNCGYYTVGNVFNQETNCGSVPIQFINNNVLGYTDPNQGIATAFLFVDPGTTINFTNSYNNEYGLKSGTTDTCGVNNITCVDPLLLNEPAQVWPGTETDLDVYSPASPSSFTPLAASGLIRTGTTPCPITDYFSNTQTSPCTIGAVVYIAGVPVNIWKGTVIFKGKAIIK